MGTTRYKVGSSWKRKGHSDVPVGLNPSQPVAQTNLVVSNPTSTTIDATWTRSISSGITEQRVYLNNKFYVTVDASLSATTITGLNSATQYVVKLTAYNSNTGLNSGFSNSQTISTTDVTPGGTAPGAPTSLAASSTGTTTGTVTWAAASGTVDGYRIFLNGVQYGSDYAGTVRSASLSGLTQNTTYGVTMRAFNAAGGQGPATASVSFTTDKATTDNLGPYLFAGHQRMQAMWGLSTVADGGAVGPGWTEANNLVSSNNTPIRVGREFSNSNFSASAINSMMNELEVVSGIQPIITFKYPTWADVAKGLNDSTLLAIYNWAVGRRNAGKHPITLSYNHEPAGDAGGTLSDWADMNTYCSHWLAGRRGGTATSSYVAANDVTDMIAWSPIGNGFWWNTSKWANAGSDADTAWPSKLLQALRMNGGAILNDFYDIDYIDMTKAMTDASYRQPKASGTFASDRLTNFFNWYNARVPDRDIACGSGELGTITGTELYNCWKVIRANRDVWAITIYFDSMNASDHDWRLVPANYPSSNYTSSKGLKDLGGDANSAARLSNYRTILAESISATYSGAI